MLKYFVIRTFWRTCSSVNAEGAHGQRKVGNHWRRRTTVAEISLFKEVSRHSEFYEFHSCAVCREVSHYKLFGKMLSPR